MDGGLLLGAVLFGGLLALSWRRSASFDGDLNREWTTPARVAAGERLYADVGSYYGPLAPWLGAAACRVAGPRVGTAYGVGIGVAATALALVLLAARRFVATEGRLAVAAVGVGVLAFAPSNGALVTPYSLAAVLAVALVWTSFVAASAGRAAIAGVLAGLALLAKVEAAPALLGPLLLLPGPGRALFGAVAGALAACGYAAATYGIPLADLATYGPLRHLPPPSEFRELYARISGLHPALLGRAVRGAASGAALVAGWALFVPAALARQGSRVALGAGLVVVALFGRPDEDVLTTVVRGLPVATVLAAVAAARRRGTPDATLALAAALLGLGFAWRTFFWTVPSLPYAPIAAISLLPALAWAVLRGAGDGVDGRHARVLLVAPALVAPLLFLPRLVDAYRSPRTAVVAPRGTWLPPEPGGSTFAALVAKLEPLGLRDGELVVVPEASALGFLLGVRSPLRLEQLLPGHLDERADADAAERLRTAPPRRIVVFDRSFPEFGGKAFGRDYGRRVAAVLATRYEIESRLEPAGGAPVTILRPKARTEGTRRASASKGDP